MVNDLHLEIFKEDNCYHKDYMFISILFPISMHRLLTFKRSFFFSKDKIISLVFCMNIFLTAPWYVHVVYELLVHVLYLPLPLGNGRGVGLLGREGVVHLDTLLPYFSEDDQLSYTYNTMHINI